ncbi:MULTISPECIES: alanyl-tRNA editing protein [unclassified Romboutsia]|uniref:alanyl-tRNA editing protein n=1 Tax=unclassified Romboutsia TaxID=2626894 RepID=UPI00189BAB5F|nr:MULTISPECIES: DHHA1 domain-containing protein [unclassified Romboutsia]MDB8804956.1 DHHA1 domain-containing protein [Romboutsia sp. 1001216sp1]MDB8808588.1 DHHA1 domain-containing protein [Romboutsia sp. 1001216sp1]MDB8810601.1 DHHA1 domain-containing protein [Romboutsia sp. 1001216sp1]MDB8816321.1 DHHA1 domain-containing protein [Romboutsia sp. 1001216sp1]MDB8818726.1 DHHA1 domain-containing protein [Romboutsia sp. 1001216sp1]
MEKLYYTNQYIKEFVAEIEEILEVNGKYHIVLDKTAFFPGGGGQFCDLGKIDVHDVLDVYEKDNKVYHVVEKKPIKIHKVKCFIDWERREDGMHQHFAQHILSGCFYTLFKKNTTAFHLGSEISTVDIKGPLTTDEIREVERMANDIISENIEVETLIPSKKDLKKIWIRRDLPDTSEEIRIVKIGDLDSNACCGVHPKSTLDVRMIKIRRWEKNKDSIRIEFLAGKRAINSSLKRDIYLTDICRYLSSTEEEAINGVKKLHDKLEDALYEKRKIEDVIVNFEIKEMINNSDKVNDISIIKKIYIDKDIKYISKIASKITESENVISLVGVKNDGRVNLVFASSKNINTISMNNILRDTMTLLDGRGGGSTFLAQGGGKNNGNLEVAIDYAFDKIKKELI